MSDEALKANLEQHIQGMQNNIDEGKRILGIMSQKELLADECLKLHSIVKDQRTTIVELEQTVKVLEERLHEIPLHTQYTPVEHGIKQEQLRVIRGNMGERDTLIIHFDTTDIRVRLPAGWHICEKADS